MLVLIRGFKNKKFIEEKIGDSFVAYSDT